MSNRSKYIPNLLFGFGWDSFGLDSRLLIANQRPIQRKEPWHTYTSVGLKTITVCQGSFKIVSDLLGFLRLEDEKTIPRKHGPDDDAHSDQDGIPSFFVQPHKRGQNQMSAETVGKNQKALAKQVEKIDFHIPVFDLELHAVVTSAFVSSTFSGMGSHRPFRSGCFKSANIAGSGLTILNPRQ